MDHKVNLQEILDKGKEVRLKRDMIIRTLASYIKIHEVDCTIILENDEIVLKFNGLTD